MARAKKTVEKSADDGTLARLCTWYEDAVTATYDARTLAERDRDYYDNKQWTPEEVSKLKERGQPAITINRVKPKVDFLLGTERQTRTDPHAFPRNPQDEKSSEAATDALRYVADCNDFDQIRSEVFENLIIEGIGAAIVEVDKKQKVKIVRIPWDRFFYDPHSRKRDFSDALYLGIVTWMDRSQVQAMYPEGGQDVFQATIDDETSTTYGDRPKSVWIDSNRKRIKVCEVYYLDGEDWKSCVYTKSGYLRKPEASAYVDEDGVPACPICAISAHVDRDNNRYGVVRQLIGVQDEINKRRSKALHLISTRQFKIERGAVDDVHATKRELAKPDGIVEVNPGMGFELIDTSDMAAGNLNLLAEAKAEIDAVGANAALQGKQEGSASGRALQSRQQSGLVELGPVLDSLRHWQRMIHRQVWYRIKQYWRAPMWVRVTDDEQAPKYVGLNQPTTVGEQVLEEAKAKGLPPDQMQQLMQQIQMDPQAMQLVVQNEVARMDMDIIIAEAPDTVNLHGEQFDLLSKMYQANPKNAQNPEGIPFEVVIEASSLRGKEKLLSKLKGDDDEQAKAQQMEQAQKAQQYQEASAQADLAVKQAEAQLKQAQAAKTMAEAQMGAPTQPDQMPEVALKAEADLRKTQMAGQFDLEKTAMQQEGETQRHVMSLSAEQQRSESDAMLALREQNMRSEQASRPQK